VLSIHSSKGLEFPAVILLGIGQLSTEETRCEENARLLYVGMTRAMERLLAISSSDNEFCQRLISLENATSN
jgi:superfamily I DNA/RNA helicase